MREGYLASLVDVRRASVNRGCVKSGGNTAKPEVGEAGAGGKSVFAGAREAPAQVVPPSAAGDALRRLVVTIGIHEGILVALLHLRVRIGRVGAPLPDAAQHIVDAERAH